MPPKNTCSKTKNRELQEKIKLMDTLLSKSKLTEEDALFIGRKINEEIARKHNILKYKF